MVKLIYQFAFYSTDLQANNVKINKFRTTKNIKKILKSDPKACVLRQITVRQAIDHCLSMNGEISCYKMCKFAHRLANWAIGFIHERDIIYF